MKFDLFFAKEDTLINWNKRDAVIRNANGKVVFEQTDVEAPETWSDNAVNIVASKYFKRINGVQETSVKQLIKRVVDKILQWGDEYSYFSSSEDKAIFATELTHLLVTQRVSFNSPIWFNFGVPSRSQQAAACFLIGLEDSMESIDTWMAVESKIFQGGSGSGTRASNLRHKNAPISAGGCSSGPLAFMKASDHKAGAIKSGGTTRRAAKLVCFDVNHPDIKDFIHCKTVEEKKAQALIAAGYDSSIDGDAYTTVAFQNTNHSVQVDDKFMMKVESGDKEACELLRDIAQHAWESGDPGLQFIDTINYWNTIPNSGPITTSNPCGEYLSTDWSSCLLASFNLLKFNSGDHFDFEGLTEAVRIMTVAMDIIICGADYPDERFKVTAQNQRQIGLGYSNLGALLMARGVAYDSDDARRVAQTITSCITAEAYYQSAMLAKDMDPFKDYEKNKDIMLALIKEQMGLFKDIIAGYVSPTEVERWNKTWEAGKQYGYRNSTVTLLAPTGTISFMMDCDTTSAEPEVALVKYKSMVGGGHMPLINGTVKQALFNLGYEPLEVIAITEHILDTGTIENCKVLKEEHLSIFDCALKAEKGVRYINYNAHMKMMEAIQPFLSMGISKTINMPNSATVQDIYKLYLDAWRMKLKSITVYRDGCKQSQPLNVTKSMIKEEPKQIRSRKPLPDERKSITHKIEIAGFEGYMMVGMYDDGTPGEVFINASKQGSTVSGLLDAFATAISYGLQYGVPLEFLVEKFSNQRFEPSGFTKNPAIPLTTSIVDYVFKWLKLKFIENKETPIVNVSKPVLFDGSMNGYLTLAKSEGLYNGNSHLNGSNGIGHLSGHPLMISGGSYLSQTGETCNVCGSMMVRTGTCLGCNSCGQTSGGCGG